MKLELNDIGRAAKAFVGKLPTVEEALPELKSSWTKRGGAAGIVGSSLHRAWAARLGNEIAECAYEKVLIVCGGDGACTVALARRLGRSRVSIACLSSRSMLSAAEAAESAEPGNIDISMHCAAALDFADGSFDCAVALYALEEAGDAAALFGQLRRVAKTGACVYCLEDTDSPDTVKQSAARPLRSASPKKLPRRADICRAMLAAGLEKVCCYSHILDAAACCRGAKPEEDAI